MFGKWLSDKKKSPKPQEQLSILGLRIGCSFEIDTLFLKLVEDELVIKESNNTHIIQAAGLVDLGGTYLFRFYTDDDAFLQVVAEGGKSDEHVVDVKLYHFYDTLDISSEATWNDLLYKKIGAPTYALEGHEYQRVWTSVDDYHNPVHMAEKTTDSAGESSETDQFTMLFERAIKNEMTESLFLSAEETEDPPGQLNRCLVMSTGITLSPSQITIHG